eukprot:GHVQ01004654.1.p1 GENE.GHVQ01004654.1~~GHVQ01004654.1.p1  ORF type:complete len:475 (+),score=58.63 GHVQ01004654.1:211-1635(+)
MKGKETANRTSRLSNASSDSPSSGATNNISLQSLKVAVKKLVNEADLNTVSLNQIKVGLHAQFSLPDDFFSKDSTKPPIATETGAANNHELIKKCVKECVTARIKEEEEANNISANAKDYEAETEKHGIKLKDGRDGKKRKGERRKETEIVIGGKRRTGGEDTKRPPSGLVQPKRRLKRKIEESESSDNDVEEYIPENSKNEQERSLSPSESHHSLEEVEVKALCDETVTTSHSRPPPIGKAREKKKLKQSTLSKTIRKTSRSRSRSTESRSGGSLASDDGSDSKKKIRRRKNQKPVTHNRSGERETSCVMSETKTKTAAWRDEQIKVRDRLRAVVYQLTKSPAIYRNLSQDTTQPEKYLEELKRRIIDFAIKNSMALWLCCFTFIDNESYSNRLHRDAVMNNVARRAQETRLTVVLVACVCFISLNAIPMLLLIEPWRHTSSCALCCCFCFRQTSSLRADYRTAKRSLRTARC